ncbi:MAG: DUF2721 domain-containing protein [Bacteroidetes bacterium]|nr:DUF2721 domain-containing protein [Bacteroidota bacterium]
MELSITTPALLFPAISLLMLAYTNKFLAMANLVRNLNSQYKQNSGTKSHLSAQISNLSLRLVLIKYMQALGVLSFFFCVLSMAFIFYGNEEFPLVLFAMSLLSLLASLGLSLYEIFISTKALQIELKDIEDEQVNQTTHFL